MTRPYRSTTSAGLRAGCHARAIPHLGRSHRLSMPYSSVDRAASTNRSSILSLMRWRRLSNTLKTLITCQLTTSVCSFCLTERIGELNIRIRTSTTRWLLSGIDRARRPSGTSFISSLSTNSCFGRQLLI